MTALDSASDSAAAGIGGSLAAIVFIVFALALYFLPTVIAFLRHHLNAPMIAILNFFLGWTFIGWVIFLAMSFGNPAPHTTNVYTSAQPPADPVVKS